MSLQLSSGTLDSLAGVFAPTRKHGAGGGGGKGKVSDKGGRLLGGMVARMFPQATRPLLADRLSPGAKAAFGGSSPAAASRRAISTLDRTARRAPEVMVRVTGRQHGGGHVLANFAYISRLGHGADKELALHTSDGEIIRDGRKMQELAQEWHEWELGDDARRKGATSLSMILSMPTGTDPEQVKAAALDFAKEEFANRSWVASLHVDRDHPHVHLTIARRDYDGRRFHPNRDDLFRYRQRFARKLRDRGIEANATPAKARGVDPKHEHIVARKVRAKGQIPRLDKTRAARAERVRVEGASDPARTILSDRHASVRQAYERSIAELRSSPSIVNQTVASSLQRFLDGLGEPEPNSITAARTGPKEPMIDGRSGALRAGEEGRAVDPVGAALARSTAMRDRLEARRALDRTSSAPSSSRNETSSPAAQRPASRPPDHVVDPPPARPSDGMEEIARQVVDRDRERLRRDRQRDRSLDKGAPKR